MRACRTVDMALSSYRYEAQAAPDEASLRRLLRAHAEKRRRWGYRRLQTLLIRDGYPIRKPSQNGFIESFNRKLRDECLNENVFLSLMHARNLLEDFIVDYNEVRPHSSLGMMPPANTTARSNAGAPSGDFGSECHLANPIYNQQPQLILKLSLKPCSFGEQVSLGFC